jgi:hypothetical protein
MQRTLAFVVATTSGNSILNLPIKVNRLARDETRRVERMHQLRSRKKLLALFL